MIFTLDDSRIALGAALAGGGGMPSLAVRLELGAASKGCLGAGRLELARAAFGTGVDEPARDSPMVMRMNSACKPSSLYVNCIGLMGMEYRALTIVLLIPA